MDFSDDEDFFGRAGEDEEEQMGQDAYESFQPPEDDLQLYQEMLGSPHEDIVPEELSFQPSEDAAEAPESTHPAAGPASGSDTPTPLNDASPPRLPLVSDSTRTRLLRKTPPTGPWSGVQAPGRAPVVSSQPPVIPGSTPLDDAHREWWDAKSEREKYRYVWNYVKRNNLYNTWLQTQSRAQRQRSTSHALYQVSCYPVASACQRAHPPGG